MSNMCSTIFFHDPSIFSTVGPSLSLSLSLAILSTSGKEGMYPGKGIRVINNNKQ